MKFNKIIALAMLIITSRAIQAEVGDEVLRVHNAYVNKLVEASTKADKCTVMLEYMHPEQIKLTVAYEYANLMFDEIADSAAKEYEKTKKFPGGNVLLKPLKSNGYINLSVNEKYTVLCTSENSKTFNLEKLDGYIVAQKVSHKSDNEITLVAVPEKNKNQKYYYFWKKDGNGKWKFFNGSLSPKPYPELSEKARLKIIEILANINGIEVVFGECFKINNNVFNVDDVTRMLTIVYNKSIDEIIGDKKSVLEAAIQETKVKYTQVLAQPNSCDSDLARGQVVSAIMNQLQQNISQVIRLSMK